MKQRRIVGRVVFYAVRVISKENLCIPLSLQGNGSVNTFPLQCRIVGGVVFYAVLVVSKESMRLILPRTYCFNLLSLFKKSGLMRSHCSVSMCIPLSLLGYSLVNPSPWQRIHTPTILKMHSGLTSSL
jgi:hypothetical protein